jgi:hypothetical protein
MRHPRFSSMLLVATACAILGTLASLPAQAQAPGQAPAPAEAPAAVPPGPYKPVTIVLPTAVADPTFEAFRKQLADIAQKKDRAALARLVATSFFWIPEDVDVADKKKSGVDNLAHAIGLHGRDALGWEAIAGYAVEQTAMNDPERPGVICAPGEPGFDENAADALAEATQTDAADWGYPTKDGIEVRAHPRANAAVVDKLGLHLVRVLPDDSPGNAVTMAFLKVMTPAGKTGFVPSDTVLPLVGEQMCYVKEGNAWKIAGYVGGEHSR